MGRIFHQSRYTSTTGALVSLSPIKDQSQAVGYIEVALSYRNGGY